MTTTADVTTVTTGFGPTRKGRKSAQREADMWNASGSGTEYTYAQGRPTKNWDGTTTQRPSYTETIVAEVQDVEGGFACAYVTTRTTHTTEEN
jgi:hypothetical protein